MRLLFRFKIGFKSSLNIQIKRTRLYQSKLLQKLIKYISSKHSMINIDQLSISIENSEIKILVQKIEN